MEGSIARTKPWSCRAHLRRWCARWNRLYRNIVFSRIPASWNAVGTARMAWSCSRESGLYQIGIRSHHCGYNQRMKGSTTVCETGLVEPSTFISFPGPRRLPPPKVEFQIVGKRSLERNPLQEGLSAGRGKNGTEQQTSFGTCKETGGRPMTCPSGGIGHGRTGTPACVSELVKILPPAFALA